MNATIAHPDLAASGGSKTRGWTILLVTLVIGLIADLGSKWWAFHSIADAPVVVKRDDVLAQTKIDPTDLMRLIPPHKPVGIHKVFEFQLVLNNGAVFGAGQGKRWMFIGFTAVVLIIAMYSYARYASPKSRWTPFAVGLVVSGGIGNLYDRIVFGCVRDFLHPLAGLEFPGGIRWPNGSPEVWPYVSNVADAALLFGIAILIVKMWHVDTAAKKSRSAPAKA